MNLPPNTLSIPKTIWQGSDFVNTFTLPERFWLAETNELCIATKMQLMLDRYEQHKHKLYDTDAEYVI